MGARVFSDIRPGLLYNMQLAVVVFLWFMRRRREPTIEDIQREFDVSRATAYRWKQAVREILEREKAAGRDITGVFQ